MFRLLIVKEKMLSRSDMMIVCSYWFCELKTCLSLYYHDQFVNWQWKEKEKAKALDFVLLILLKPFSVIINPVPLKEKRSIINKNTKVLNLHTGEVLNVHTYVISLVYFIFPRYADWYFVYGKNLIRRFYHSHHNKYGIFLMYVQIFFK